MSLFTKDLRPLFCIYHLPLRAVLSILHGAFGLVNVRRDGHAEFKNHCARHLEMHIILAGWLFVVLLVTAASLAEGSWISAVVVFVGLGVAPVWILASMGAKTRSRRAEEAGARPPESQTESQPKSEP